MNNYDDDSLQDKMVAFKTKRLIFLPRTITKFMYRLIASAAITMNVTKKKYCNTAPVTAQRTGTSRL